jgi:hypothetical protein
MAEAAHSSPGGPIPLRMLRKMRDPGVKATGVVSWRHDIYKAAFHQSGFFSCPPGILGNALEP